MNEYLIVDGYNIIYAWRSLDKLKSESLEHARDKLVEVLANYSAISGEKVFVVFDAHQVKDNLKRMEEKNGIDVIYTREGETADAVIEKMVGELTGEGRVYVVTSDFEEQRVIFGQGAYRLTPGDLKNRIDQFREKEKNFSRETSIYDNYLENRLGNSMRKMLEEWRRNKK